MADKSEKTEGIRNNVTGLWHGVTVDDSAVDNSFVVLTTASKVPGSVHQVFYSAAEAMVIASQLIRAALEINPDLAVKLDALKTTTKFGAVESVQG